ncbi:sorting nexin-14-like isoform X2 [Octopus vulgaris]|uniref:Sorting nexin-14-like isoform X2 n=1 Tax=Octopus vulgaris TaxID=6645 RepID=A0AA36AVZ7_OCTVU|nr:sorting nexin-14-like isoform X2 [Octopus vulgaris]
MAVPWYLIKFYAQNHTKFTSAVLVLFIASIIFHTYIHLFLLVWSFIFGIVVAYFILSKDSLLPNLLFMYNRKIVKEEEELSLMKTMCSVCGQRKCPRHRPELNILAFQPWNGINIPQSVDKAVGELLELVFKEFIYSWFKDLSIDEEFVQELRNSLRFFAAVLLRRAQKIDIPDLITSKLSKAGLAHLDSYLQTKKRVPIGTDLQHATLNYLGPSLHVAMQSRKMELEYLRRLTESLFPFIIQPYALHSPSTCNLVREVISGSLLQVGMDVLADPDNVNNLILVFLDNTPPPIVTKPPTEEVPFLTDLADVQVKNTSCLHLELADIMSQTDLLYTFMQFMKSEAAVSVLQFCLACADFSGHILNPDLTDEELKELHNTAKDLYQSYCAPYAVDKILFADDVVTELKSIVDGPYQNVIKLRTSPPLFKAYEHAYNLLESTFLPLFHQSDEYYKMLCGDRCVSQAVKVGTKLEQKVNFLPLLQKDISRSTWPQKKKEFGFSNFGNKIKEVFKSSSIEGKLPEVENTDDADTVTIASCSSLEDEISYENFYDWSSNWECPLHDLSTWRITIPRIGGRPDPDNIKKLFFVFIIDVHRVDVSSEDESQKASWTVARRYQEFYVLEQRLTEFHGGFSACQLPPKKSFGTKNQDFMESKKEQFEQYLQKLVAIPQLRGSELLYNFLTSKDELTSSFLPDINIGKIVKSVPMKLLKERGQHIDPFLQSFLQSTEAPKPRPCRLERKGSDTSLKSVSSEKFSSPLFENNFNCENSYPLPAVSDNLPVGSIHGIFNMFIYIARYVYHIPEWFHHILIMFRMLLKRTIESYVQYYIQQKYFQICQEHRLAYYINIIKNLLFFDTDPPRTEEQKKERYAKTIAEMKKFIPSLFVLAIGEQNHHEGTKLILDLLQLPKLNKQLSYVLLDIIIVELFPELKENYSPDVRLNNSNG